MLHDRSSAEILAAGEDLLATAEQAMKELRSDSQRRLPACRNVFVFGTEFERLIDVLRGRNAKFDRWLDVHAMSEKEARNRTHMISAEILGRLAHPADLMHNTQIRVASSGRAHGAAPRNAQSFFLEDRFGGSGWEVLLADGRIEKYYLALPSSYGGLDPETEQVLARYLERLDEILQAARRHLNAPKEHSP